MLNKEIRKSLIEAKELKEKKLIGEHLVKQRLSALLEHVKNEDDFEVEGMLVDSMSMQYLSGATVDYKESLAGSQFTIINPNVTATCGCGSSFAI